jgi:hypothetical protein
MQSIFRPSVEDGLAASLAGAAQRAPCQTDLSSYTATSGCPPAAARRWGFGRGGRADMGYADRWNIIPLTGEIKMKRMWALGLAAMVWVPLVGCSAPDFDMKAFAEQRRQMPAELDHLNMFVGEWESTGTMVMEGQPPMTSTGKASYKWDADKRFLLGEESWTDSEMGTFHGTGTWTWDSSAGKYRAWWFSGMGMVGEGTSCYCPDTRTWCMKACSRDLVEGNKTVGKGTMRFVDDRTVEWHFTEYMKIKWLPLVKIKMFEMNGTMKKVN